MFGDLERTTCATPYCRVSNQDGDGFIIRHSGEEREGQDGGKVSEEENSPTEVPDTAKRRKLEDIEDQVMKEVNPTKIAELFDQYRAEYLNDREDIGGNAKRQKSEESVLLREQASGSHQSAAYAEVGVEKITEGNVDPWEFLEAVGSDNNNATQCLKPWESRGEEEFAWDDVNNIALPLEKHLVKKNTLLWEKHTLVKKTHHRQRNTPSSKKTHTRQKNTPSSKTKETHPRQKQKTLVKKKKPRHTKKNHRKKTQS